MLSGWELIHQHLDDHLDQGVFITDTRLQIIYWNRWLEKHSGHQASAAVGRNLLEMFPELVTRAKDSYYQKALEGQMVLLAHRFHQYLLQMPPEIANHQLLHMPQSAKIVPVVEKDQIIGTITVIDDVTERVVREEELQSHIKQLKKTEETLRRSEAYYRSLIENTSDIIMVIDHEGMICFASPSVERVLGYFPGELNYLQVRELIHAEDLPKFTEALQALIRNPDTIFSVEARFRGQDGAWHTLEAIGKILPDRPEKPEVVINCRDITERQHAEKERLRIVKLESLGILAGGIAHDFNNILTAILGNLSLTGMESYLKNADRARLNEAEKACLRAQALAQRLVTFARGGAPVKKPTDINKLLKETANLTLCGTNIRCDFCLPEELWLVKVDEGQINQVINNLLINAQQAMPVGGIITIRAENVTMEEDAELPLPRGKHIPLPKSEYVKITVVDQGEGIPPEIGDKIFDPYFTTKPQGSGLGLATAYSIIKNHHGYITMESNAGEGSVFYIYLPALKDAIPFPEEATIEPLTGQGRILIMDDEGIVLVVLGEMLKKLGFEVASARDGREAVEIYQTARREEQPFAAVILDLTVPGGLGGKETLEFLKEINPQVKVIVSSGYSDSPIMADYEKYGVQGVISKPYRLPELSKVIHEVLTKSN
ncbi:MAG: PAS domain-containing hybrid sensor histidine kinase/response regulator [Desulfobaccales bacterium]